MKYLLLLASIFIFFCCNYESEVSNNLIEKKNFQQIVLIDTIRSQLRKNDVIWKTETDFRPIYIGQQKDSILLNYKFNYIDYGNHDWAFFQREDTLNSLIIFVDTSRIIEVPTLWDNRDSFKKYRNLTQAYPVFIKNMSLDTLVIGFWGNIPLITEAQNNLGKWTSIQEPLVFNNTFGKYQLYLPPKSIAITACNLYKGNFKTKIRLRFGENGNIYSNEFEGTISPQQFEISKYVSANKIYDTADEMPMFPACNSLIEYEERKSCADKAMLDFIYPIKYPYVRNGTCSEGTAVISFIVEKDGTLTNHKIIRDLGCGTGDEALRVVKLLPNFEPGKNYGKPVRVQFNLPVRFRFE